MPQRLTMSKRCPQCGKTFHPWAKDQRFCSRFCWRETAFVGDLRAPALLNRVIITQRGCWNWPGRGGKRHPMLHGENLSRAVYRANVGMLRRGQDVRHTCDNPRCVNPGHLLLGSNADNVRDRMARGRSAKGEQTRTAKLNESAVREIRRLLDAGGVSLSELGRRFNVNLSTIRLVKRRETWAWVK